MTGVAHILGELNEDDVDWLLRSGERRSIRAGTVLVEAGLPAEALFVVLEGVLTVAAGERAVGREVPKSAPGDVIGEMSFVDARPPTATVTALEDSVVFAIPSAALTAKLELDAGFSARFHRALAVFLSDRVRSLEGASTLPGDTELVGALGGNVHLAQARFERLLSRLTGGERTILLTGNDLTIESVVCVAEQDAKVEVSPAASSRIERSREIVERLARGSEPVYGLNTGLGALRHLPIEPDENRRFQRNVLMSHAVGIGPEYGTDVVRAIMVARLNGMARGGSGIQTAAFDLLLGMLNTHIHPIVPSRGSIGMSDLAPLAHLALPLIGLGEVEFEGRRVPSTEALSQCGLQVVELSGKDALALCSANSASVGYGALVVAGALDVLASAEIAAALSLEGFAASVDALAVQVHEARPYSGQLASAERLRTLLEGSGLWEARGVRRMYQPLSFRCVAQVHGACQDALSFVRRTVETELNATGDNPVVLIEQETTLPTGNVHPAGLSIAFDMLGIALAQVISMATNRVIKLMSTQLAGLPPQLTPDPGVNTGLGVLQKTITALNAEASFLANPASLDFTPVAESVEDHATMATLSVSKAAQIVDCARHALAVELLCAAQAVDLREQAVLGRGTQAAYDAVRACVPFMPEDRLLAADVKRVHTLLATRGLLQAVNASIVSCFGLDLGESPRRQSESVSAPQQIERDPQRL